MPQYMPLKILRPKNLRSTNKLSHVFATTVMPMCFATIGLSLLTLSCSTFGLRNTFFGTIYLSIFMYARLRSVPRSWFTINVIEDVFKAIGKGVAQRASYFVSDPQLRIYRVGQHNHIDSIIISYNKKLMPLRINFKSGFENTKAYWKLWALFERRGLEVSQLYTDDDLPHCFILKAGIDDAMLHLRAVMRDIGGEFFPKSNQIKLKSGTYLKVIHKMLPTLFQGQREASALYAEDVSALTPLQSTFNNNYLIREIAERASHYRLSDQQMSEVLDEIRVKHLPDDEKGTVEPVFTKGCEEVIDRIRQPLP